MSSYRYSASHKSSKKPLYAVIGAIALAGIGLSLYGILTFTSADSTADTQLMLEQAQAHLAEQNPDQAVFVIDEFQELSGDEMLTEEAFVVLLEALDAGRDQARLAAESALFLETYPESTYSSEAEMLRLTAEVQTSGLSKPGLLASVETFLLEHPDHEGADRLALSLARHESLIGDYSAATRRLNRLATDPAVDPHIALVARQEVGNMRLDEILSGSDADQVYTVKSGDSIWKIARDFDITSELLMTVNRISDPSRLRVGETLRIPNTDFKLVCDVSRNELILYNHGEFVKSYSVRTGREPGATPQGTFKVLNKKTGPTWRPGDGRVYLPGDPNNELGTRWMAFEGDILGIHGTIHPETVGSYASNGCIGMKTEDVEELFDLILVGTPLTIKGEQDLNFAQIIPAPVIPDPLTKSEIAQLN